GWQDHQARRQGRRPGVVRQMVRHRGQARRRGPPDHEGVRHHGRDRLTSTNANAARLLSPPSCPDLMRASILFARRWIAGSSPTMTRGAAGPTDQPMERLEMAAKDVRFAGDAREKILRAVDILPNAVKAPHVPNP